MIHYHQPFLYRFSEIEIRFGDTEMDPALNYGVQFTDDHNKLCAIHGSQTPISDYGVYRCQQILHGQYLTIQRPVGTGYVELAEVDIRVMIKSGTFLFLGKNFSSFFNIWMSL